jgi:single-strand DNA-binding protein
MAGIGLNKILLIGNLTKDPELRYLPNGTPKAELRLATSRTYTTNNEKREDTCFVDVIAWSRTAENVNQYLKKGAKIFVEGRLDYQEWEGQDGSRRSKHQVVADRIQFLDSRGGGQGGGGEMGEGGEAGGFAPRAQRSYGNGAASGSSNGGGYSNGGNGGGPRGNYGPRAYGQGNGGYGAPAPAGDAAPAAAAAPAHASAPQGEMGLESRPPAGASMGEAMGINDDDIPF